MIEMTHHVHQVLLSVQYDVVSLESRPLIFVYLCTQSILKQFVQYDIKSKHPKEYWHVDKVGREKAFRINRLLISYLISKQARNTDFKSVLVLL